MNTTSCHHLKTGFTCFFIGEDLAAADLWDVTNSFLDDTGLASRCYTITQGLGRRRKFRNPAALLTSDEIRREIVSDDSNSFWVFAEELPVQALHFSPTSMDGGHQKLNIAATVTEQFRGWHTLAATLSSYSQMVMADTFNQPYTGWQNCPDPSAYQRLYGSIDGFPTRELQPLPESFNPRFRLDLSLNPGRRTQSGLLPQRAAAELWLGKRFWDLAKCTKEEVLAADFFLEKRDTPHFLYLKSWQHPFTRPDGEQGRQQQRLWKLLFHEDCEWPPGSGTICDEPMYGPPELMP